MQFNKTKSIRNTVLTVSAASLALSLSAGSADASMITVSVEDTQGDGGFFFTPFWLGIHDGSFDTFNGGELSAGFPGITTIAEVGSTAPQSARFDSEVPGGTQTTLTATSIGAPVFEPGESSSVNLDVTDSSTYRYFSFASMVIPTNDLFVANDDPGAYAIFNEDGTFAGPVEILLYGRSVYDNGTEQNSATNDPAFFNSDGQAIPEVAVVRSLDLTPGGADALYLASFDGAGLTPTGAAVTVPFGADDLIGRITITEVPEPASMGIAAMGLLGLAARRRRA